MDRSFYEARVNVPKLSGFDKSFQNLFTAPVGTLVPALFDEIMAGSIIDLDMAVSASLPPLASDTFMRCSLKVEAFLVPMRLCYGGFEHFFVGDSYEVMEDINEFSETSNKNLPNFVIDVSPAYVGISMDHVIDSFGAGSLADFLGLKTYVDELSEIDTTSAPGFNILPWIAYHKIWSDWYRSSLIQRDCFAPLSPAATEQDMGSPACLPFVHTCSFFDRFVYSPSSAVIDQLLLADGVSVFALRQRNFGFDYFTTATPSPQNGDPARVTMVSAGQGFTVSQLRSANSLQQFRERNNLAGDRYVDRLYAQYGIRPSDGVAQRTLCIGSGEFEVYNKGVYENNNVDQGASSSQNPFGGLLGNRGGSASASGRISLCKGLKVAEPSYLFVMTSLVPRVTYSMGVSPILLRYTKDDSIGEMANPILQNIGPEPIYCSEMSDDIGDLQGSIFGYTDRYGSFKNKFDELHGLLRDGESLESFAAQRYFGAGSEPKIDSEFLEIPKDYLDNVTAVSGDLSKYGVWVDSYFKYHVSMPLARYSLPTLQDPAYEHGRSITVTRGGHRF